MWRQGWRRNSPEAMGLFTSMLDDQQIRALAAYYQQAIMSKSAFPAQPPQ